VAGRFGCLSARAHLYRLDRIRATRVKGQAAYVIVTGNSMEPGFHLGDLAIVRRASIYQIGGILQIIML